ncbi:hypothetical protein [Cohnella yongneupensis]|uniref:Phosphodiester glycosidase domain-containing protein n=1 Tax=Cohnella yongneupensis TaxID=425006 RepID=A0ABW0R1C7_9BACL
MRTTFSALIRHLFRFKVFYIAGAVLALAIYVLTHLSIPKSVQPEPTGDQYSYEHFIAANNVSLHVVKTVPGAVHLRIVDDNVTRTGIVGVNGGFFWEKQLLSIAVENDQPAGGTKGQRGSGWFNAKYARGTLVYDGDTGLFSVQVVSDADQIKVQDRSRYWAQGGISLNLRDDVRWRAQAETEAIPVPDEFRLRSAMAYDGKGQVYLFVTDVRCTAEDYRKAILEYGNAEAHRLIDGIFLDGDGSSQLSTREAMLSGDGRAVLQMIGVD